MNRGRKLFASQRRSELDSKSSAKPHFKPRVAAVKSRGHALQVLALLAMLFALALSVPQAHAVTTFSGTLGSNSATFPGTSGTQTGRIARRAPASTCAAPKEFPGLNATDGSRAYDAYTLTNPSSTDACTTVTYTLTGGGAGAGLLAVAYLNSFDPSNISTNYLADPGQSVSPGSDGPKTFSFKIPAGQTAVLVIHDFEVAGNVGATYDVTVAGLPESFVVTSTADPGNGTCTTADVADCCTLREAITAADANANPGVPDTISFNIPGDGVKTIIPADGAASEHHRSGEHRRLHATGRGGSNGGDTGDDFD